MSHYNHRLMTVNPIHCCKEIFVDVLHAEKIAKAVLLFEFIILFSGFLSSVIEYFQYLFINASNLGVHTFD